MSDDGQVPMKPTPDAALEEQVMSWSFPKNEREWWAKHEIDRLREALAPFAGLDVPARPKNGNAGFYSIRFDDIARAKAVLQHDEQARNPR